MPKIIIRQKNPLPATAIVKILNGDVLVSKDIASGASFTVKLNVVVV